MDYPKSVPSVGLVDGKFVDENQSTGVVGSLIPSAWGNAVTDEILNVLVGAGIAPAEGTNNQLLAAIRALTPGRLIGVQVFISSATYTPTSGTRSIVVKGVGGGGAGGGAVATAASTVSVGAGGTAGSYGEGRFTSGFSGQSVVIGASGVPVAGANGGNGSTTSLGSLISIPGGTGGSKAGAAAPPFMAVGSSGVAPSGANLVGCGGAPGSPGIAISTTFGVPGSGGSSAFGGGASTSAGGIVGAGANGPGAGGAGAFQGASGTALAGGTGANGILIILEYA